MSKHLMKNRLLGHIDFFELMGTIPAFPKVLPSDIDMVYERNGCFLFGEWKRDNLPDGTNEEVSEGQKILLQSLAKKNGVTVLIVMGNTDDEMVVNKIYRVKGDGKCHLAGEGVERLKEIIRDWWSSSVTNVEWVNDYNAAEAVKTEE